MKLRRGRYSTPPRTNRIRNQINPEPNSKSTPKSIPEQIPEPNPSLRQKSNQLPDQETTHGQADVSLQDALDKLYTDINSVPSFSAKINAFLRKNHVHSVHKRIVKKTFPRRKIIARFPFDIWMGDLIEYPQFKFNNRQHVYILILIDCFTKKVYSAPMRDKTMQSSVKAFQSIFHHLDEFPTHIVTDGGLGKIYFLIIFHEYLEFFNSEVRKLFINYGINHYKIPTKTKWKASMVERVNRTIKSRIQKYFYKNKTKNWIDIIDKVVDNYNNTPHSVIGFAPNQVSESNRKQVYKRLFPDLGLRTVCKLKRGDRVRKIINKDIHEKGYTKNWSEQIFIIEKVKQSNGVCYYYLKDLANTSLSGIFYYYQLNFVSRDADPPTGPGTE